MASVDFVKETELFIIECEMKAQEWKQKAEGARLLYRSLLDKAKKLEDDEKQDSQPANPQAKE